MGFTIEGVVNIDADISKFSSKMNDIEAKYTQAKEKVESEKISTSPLADDRTKGDVESSYSYMFDSFNQAKTILESLQNVSTSLPQNIQRAVSSLVGGIDQSLTTLTGSVTTAGKKMKTSFNDIGFNNNIRFASESIQSYTKDLQSAIESAQALSKRSRAIVDQNVGQIAAVVSPAISRMSIHDKASMSDAQIVEQMMTGRDYSHIPALLHQIGLRDDKQMREALNFAVKTSTSRIFRRDAGMGYRYAGMKDSGDPILVSDMVQGTYKDALFSGGRYIDEKTTPTPKTNGASDKERTRAYYQAIRKEVMRGNSVAYNAARDAGLLEQSNGEYSFAREGDVLNNPAMLNQFAGLVTREAHHALQGQPQHRRRLDDPNNQSALLGKDSTRIREARYLMNLDQRPDAAPYVVEDYQIPEGIGYRTGKRMAVPELKIPETINIPRMTVRQTAQGAQLMVPRRNKDNNLVYEPDLNFQWQKQGVQETLEDEWVTMGRNPVIDRLERLSKRTDLKPELREAIAGFKFEDRTFGRGYDKNNEAVTGAPLIVDVPLDYFYDRNKHGEMQFRTKENGDRESYFSGDNETLINEMYKGNIRPVLSYGGKNLDYRVFAGKTTGGGSLKLMLNSAYEALEQEDVARGLPSMLNFFNELGPNGILINPKTGKEFENTEAANAAYAKWFDARNKILSHSIPIESLGGKTPTAALVNLDAAYEAMGTLKSHRFDGGGFIDPDVYTQDFQARMGPAKFLAQRFDWKQWFKDTGYAYQGGEFDGDTAHHFFMPGMATSADDYKKYRAALRDGVGLDAKSFTMDGKTVGFGGQSFRDWRDQRFVDVMSDDFKAVLFDTTLKSTAKLSSVTPEQYQRIVEATQGKAGTAFTTDQMMQVKNGMVPLSTKQQTELFGMMADPEYGFGLRLMKDTENYAGKKDFWSPAYMSAVMMTPALMRQSQENYEKAFQELSTPEGIIKRMFSGNDIDSLRVQKNPSLIYRDKFIQQAVQAEINDLEDKQMRGYAYMPGSAQMLLATANPTFLAAIGKDMTGKELSGIAAELNVGEHGIIAPTVSQEGTINWTRSPYAPGASFFASPYARTAANRYRLSQNSAMFNVEDFYTLNTGDFDGDFVWAYQTLKDDKDFIERTNERNRRVQELAAKREAEEARIKAQDEAINGKQDRTVEHDVTGFGTATLRTNNTLGPIGLGYKEGQAWRQIEATPEELAQIDDYANKTYANGIDMVKHTDVKVAQALGIAREAMSTRQPIERMTDALLSEKETGTFGATDIFKYGLPTYIDPIGSSILAGAAAGRRANVNYGERIKTAIRDNIDHRFTGAYQEERDLADWYGNLLGGKLSGEFQISTLQDLSEGRTKLAALGNRIKAISDNNPQAEELKDMQDLYRHAENALKLEETLGYNEGNIESIKRYNTAMHWDNPVEKYGFKTKSEQDAATILYEREQAARYAEAQQSRKNEIAQVISEQTGRVPGKVDEGYLADRLMAAHMFTGFNWSNAKNWMNGTLRANGAMYGGLRQEDGITSTVDVDYNAAVEEANRLRYTHGQGMSRKEQVARQILTGESFTDADAIVGLAAHAYMDAYGSARALSERNSKGEVRTSAEEAANIAYKAFEEELLGKNGVLSDEQKKARKDAGGITFGKREDGSIYASYEGVAEDQLSKVQQDTLTRINNKLALASRNEYDRQGSLDKVAADFYEEAFQRKAGDHMIMTEGTPFELGEDGQLHQVASRRREGHNGIWMKPTRDGKEVIDFERYSKDASGHTVVSNAGMYFTPDMIKKDDNGNITIVDWKSSQHGQKDALFQMGFYAHQLEQLGRQYHETGDENLKWFGQFVDKDTGRSRVTGLQAVNMFGKKGEEVLSYKYTQEWGDQVSKSVEGGMQALAEDAKKGFYSVVKEDIGVRTNGREVGGSRPTVAPEIKEEDAHFSNLEEAGLIGRLLNPLRMNDEVAAGRTGIKDAEGHYIDQDKSFLVAKYMKDKEELDEINAFANKQNKYLNNRSFEQLDPFTRNIDSLRQKFGEQDYATIQKYMQNPLQYAPDLELMSKDFDQTQHEALQTTMRLMGLRRQYVDQLDSSMGLDYNNILYGEGDELSKLRSGTAKYQRDLSALEAVRAESTLYNSKTGRFKTREELDAEIEARKDNESEDQYNARVEKTRKENEKLAIESERLQTKYDTQEKSIKEAFGTFEGGWIENFKKSAEYLNGGLGSLFKDGSIDTAITGLQTRARDYTREADTKLPDDTYLHGTDEREAIASLVTRLQDRAKEFEGLKGSELESLLGYGNEFDAAKLNAIKTGTQVSQEDTRKKAMYDFAAMYVRANSNATAQELMESVNTYGQTYDTQHDNQETFRELQQENQLAAIRDQNEARNQQLERQFAQANRQQRMRYSSSRLANAIYGVQQRRDSAEAQYESLNRQVASETRNRDYLKQRMEKAPAGSEDYKKAADAYAQSEARLQGLTQAAGTAKEQLTKLNSVGAMGQAVFGSFSQSVSMLLTRFGRQLFQKALTEAKKFVQEFDATMTSIQMITLKTDDQMSTLGDGLIAKAKELKISIGEITKSAETLYRQGLSDKEVSERLDVISKFSKVSGTKVDAATKLITVAMNTGLVSNPQMAADIVTALGDNAATNASEIEKGIEKAGAAAAADGTTFAELASMLTAITSTTQIGGNVAGRTLNTIFGRMNKIGTSELIEDENGNKISGSSVAKLLKAQGINTYDESGNKRSSYDVLYDLSRKWETMTDAEQQQIATAIAGTRQYSNFAAIMQGMSEGKVDEYMQLAGDASGITDKKYDVYVESLQASLTDLKNTFDKLVNDLMSSGVAKKVIDGLTNIVQGVDNLVNSGSGLEKIVGLMITLSIAMAAIKSGNPYAMAAGAVVAGVTLTNLHASGAATVNEPEKISAKEAYDKKLEEINKNRASRESSISRLKDLRYKGEYRTAEEELEYRKSLSDMMLSNHNVLSTDKLETTASDASSGVDSLTKSISNLSDIASASSKDVDHYADGQLNQAEYDEKIQKLEEAHDIFKAGKDVLKENVEKEAASFDLNYDVNSSIYGELWRRNENGTLLRGENGELQSVNLTNFIEFFRNKLGDGSFFDENADQLTADLLPLIEHAYRNKDLPINSFTGRPFFDMSKYSGTDEYEPNREINIGSEETPTIKTEKEYLAWFLKSYIKETARAKMSTANPGLAEQQAVKFYEELFIPLTQSISSRIPFESDAQEDPYDKLLRSEVENLLIDAMPDYVNQDYAKYVAKGFLEKFKTTDVYKTGKKSGTIDPNVLINSLETELGLISEEVNPNNVQRQINRLAAAGGYDAYERARQDTLRQLGVLEGEAGDYYLGEDNNLYSEEDVKQQFEDYTNLVDLQTRKYKRKGTTTGLTYDEKDNFTSLDEANAYEKEEAKGWYFKDSEGNVILAKDEEDAERLRQEYIEAGKSRVRRTYYNPNTDETKVYEGTERGEGADAFQAQYEADLARPFGVRVKGTSQAYGTEMYGTQEEAEQALAAANEIERIAYEQRLKDAEAARYAAFISTYGEEAGNLIYDYANGNTSEKPYFATDKEGNIIKAFKTGELADEYSEANRKYYNNVTGEYLGIGAEGKAAAEELYASGAFTRYYSGSGEYLGMGEEGRIKANELSDRGLYQYTDGITKRTAFAEYDEAFNKADFAKDYYDEEVQNEYENLLRELYNQPSSYIEKVADGIYSKKVELGNQKYAVKMWLDNNQTWRYAAEKTGFASYTDEFDDSGRIKSIYDEAVNNIINNLYNGIQPIFEPIKVTAYTKDIMSKADAIKSELGFNISDYTWLVNNFKEAMPQLEDIDPQVVLEVWGQIPSAIQENFIATGTVGEEALETIKVATDAVLAAQPQFKAIKNHFMSGVGTSYDAWKTKNQYATTADSMLRMIGNSPEEIKDLQSLFRYVNVNDVKEWSTLNEDEEFARIVSSIQTDEHGNILNPESQQAEIFESIKRYLYSKGLDYGQRQLSSSEKAALAQSGYNKIFARSDYFKENSDVANAPMIFDSYEAAQQYAQDKAAADQKEWQERYDAAFNESFYRKTLTAQEQQNGYWINKSGYVVDSSGILTGSRLDKEGFLVDINGNRVPIGTSEQDIETARKTFNASHQNIATPIDIVAREEEYMKGLSWVTPEEKQYLDEIVGQDVTQRLFGPEAAATDAERQYAEMLIANRAYGLTDLTEGQKTSLSANVYADLKAGKVSEYSAMSDSMRTTLMSGIAGTSDLYQMALLAEKSFYDLDELIAGKTLDGQKISDEEIARIFENRYTANDLRAINLSVAQASKLSGYQNASNYKDVASLLSGFTSQKESERISTLQSIQQSQTKLERGRYAYNQLDTSKSFEEQDEAAIKEISSVTGYSEDEIRSMWRENADSAKSKIDAALSAQFGELSNTLLAVYDIIAEGIDISSLGEDVGTEELASYLDKINPSVAKYVRAVGLVINGGVKQIEEGTESIYSSFDTVVAASTSDATETTKAMTEAKRIIDSGNYADLGANNNVEWGKLDERLLYMMNDRKINGDKSVFTNEMIGNTYQDVLLGRNAAPETQQAILSSLFGGDLSAQNMIDTYAKWKSDETKYAAQLSAYGSLEGTENLTEAMTSQTDAVDKTTQAVDNYNKQIEASQVNYQKKYGDRTQEVASKVDNLRKSTKSASEEMKNMTATMSTAANNKFFRNLWKSGDRSSRTRENIAAQLGLPSKEDLNVLTDEQIKLKLDQVEIEEIDNLQVDANAIQESMQATINEKLAGQKLELKGVEVNVANGPVTLSWDETLAQLDGFLSDAEKDFIQKLKGYGIEGYVVVNDDGNGKIKTHIEITGTGTGRKGGGGGGGGKSKIDELLEKHKHNIGQIEHENKMLDIEKKHQDFTNDYSGYNNTVDEQIKLQERLRSTYASNIKEMEEMLKAQKANSDEWWKLKEAIDAAMESMAGIDNAINDLNSERINMLNQQQENKDKPDVHALTMLQKMATRYQTTGDFANSEAIAQQTIAVYKQQIETNNKQIAEQESLLKDFEEGTDAWLAVRDKIWSIKEENAELENQVISSEIELDRARLAQIATELQQATAPLDHQDNMLGIFGGMYQRTNNYEGYRETLRGQNEGNELKLAATHEALEAVREQMKTLEEGTPAWFEARDALFQYEEAEAQLNATILENNQAIGESKVQEMSEQYDEASQHFSHQLNILQAAGEELKKSGDLESYQENLRQQADISSQSLESQIKSLEEMREALNDPDITDDAYKSLVSEIEKVEESVQKTTYSIKDMNREIVKINVEKLTEAFSYGGEGFDIGDTELQHNIQMYQYEETKYKNRGELTNYGTILSGETELQKTRSANIAKYIEGLKEQRSAIEDDEEAIKKINTDIYKWEEELSKVNNTIEQNEELLEKNKIAILKTRQAVEKAIDDEIRKRIKEERERLAATVSVENTILDTIRKNYQEQWDLQKKSIQKRKEELQQEKNLLNERLQAKKNALNTEEKYEQAARLRQQLALLQADSTRTKEAKEIAKQIADIEKDLAFQIADEQAAAQSQMYDDQIKAYDDYTASHEEELNEFLQNSENFREELDRILNGTIEDFLDFMHENSEEYKNATSEMQTQMDQGWTDTFKKMKGELDLYWDEVMPYLDNNDKEGFLEYLRGSTTYRSESETGQAILERNWEDMFDAFVSAYKDDAEYNHGHENEFNVANKIDELKDWTFNVAFDKNTILDLVHELHELYDVERNDVEEFDLDDNYEGIGKTIDPEPAKSDNKQSGEESKGTSSPSQKPKPKEEPEGKKYEYRFIDQYGVLHKSDKIYNGEEEAIAAGIEVQRSLFRMSTTTDLSKSTSVKAFKNGGLVNFTGPAWVDGTKSKPEAFLNASDTALLRSMLDAVTHIQAPYISRVDSSMFGNKASFGDVNITINEAQINNDQDINELASRIGQAFTKELSKSGLNNASYAW